MFSNIIHICFELKSVTLLFQYNSKVELLQLQLHYTDPVQAALYNNRRQCNE